MKHVNAKKKSKLISLKRKIKSNIFLIHTIELFEENIPQHLIQFTLFLNKKDYGLSETNHYLIAIKLLLTTFTISFSSMRFSSNATKVFFSNSLSVSIKLLRFCTNLILLIVQTIPLAIILGNFRSQTIIFICIHVFTHGLFILLRYKRNDKYNLFERAFSSICVAFLKYFTFNEWLDSRVYCVLYYIILFAENIGITLLNYFLPTSRTPDEFILLECSATFKSNNNSTSLSSPIDSESVFKLINNNDNNINNQFFRLVSSINQSNNMITFLFVSILGFFITISIELLMKISIQKQAFESKKRAAVNTNSNSNTIINNNNSNNYTSVNLNHNNISNNYGNNNN